MSSIFVFIGTVITTAIITTILWELKFKDSKKKLLDKINALQDGINAKQETLNKAEVAVITTKSHSNLLESAIAKKDLIIAELTSKLESSSRITADISNTDTAEPVKKKSFRGRPKKKQSSYGRSTTNNNKTEKGKQ